MTTRTPAARLRITDPGELLAALPALLGFPPHRSLVLVCLEGEGARHVGLVARVDLPPPTRGRAADADALAEQLSVLCARRADPACLLVVVEDRHPAGIPHRRLVEHVREACEAVGTAVVGVHHLRVLEAGARWSSLGGDPRSGRLPDPRSSAVAAAHVVGGRVVHSSRDSLDALLRPAAAPVREQVAGLLSVAAAELAGDVVARGDAARAQALRDVLTAVAGCGDGRDPDERTSATVAAALGELVVRDCLMALPGTDHAAAAERLWLHLVRVLPSPELAGPATLLAHGCYARGEGPLAGLALRTALEADPGHRMAELLHASLAAGLAPAGVRQLCATAWDLAAELGVTLPPLLPWE